jgi:hypothetical protein
MNKLPVHHPAGERRRLVDFRLERLKGGLVAEIAPDWGISANRSDQSLVERDTAHSTLSVSSECVRSATRSARENAAALEKQDLSARGFRSSDMGSIVG